MELFTNLIKKYTIKCHSKNFQKYVIDKFQINTVEHKDVLHIGLHNIPDEVKNFKKHLHYVLIGSEIFHDRVIDFFVRKKEQMTFYTLSIIDQNFYKENYNINSKILYFDFPKINTERIRKLLYFYKISEKADLDNNKDFNNYIVECENSLFHDIKTIKIILLEPLKSINNSFINIAISQKVNIEFINFYYLSFSDVLNCFKKEYTSFYDKFLNYKMNFIKINNFLYLLNNAKKYILNKIRDENLKQTINEIYDLKDNEKNYFILFSDNFEFLKEINNDTLLKIYITSSDQFIVRKIENNFIVVNKYFFDKNIMENLKKFHNRKTNELENKYINYQSAKNYQFIITKDSDIDYLKEYIKLFNKYNIINPISIYSPYNITLEYNGTYKNYKYDDFKVIEDSKIYYSEEFKIDQFFNQIILKDNVEVKIIKKILVLVSSTQYPSYGGAATNTYNIIKYFKKNDKIRTIGVFIDSCEDIYDKANPDDIVDVVGFNYKDFSFSDIQIKMFEKFGDIPDIAFCKNCMAPKLVKTIFPNCINIFLVSGIWGFSTLECGANEITDFFPMRKIPEEKSIELSNLIICNSDLTIKYFKKIYSDIIQNKLLEYPVDTTKYNVAHKHQKEKLKDKRTIDIIAIASNVNRPVKNVKFVKEIITFDKKFKKKKIVIIGENTEELFGDLKETHNIEIISLIKQQEVEEYLKKSKIIIIPSLFDSNSNVFREAVFNGVIPFISCNVAHPKKYPNFLILESYDAVEWSYKINYVLENYQETTQKYNLTKFFTNDDDLLDFIFDKK